MGMRSAGLLEEYHLGTLYLVNVIMVLNPAANLPLLRCTDHKQLLSQLAAPFPLLGIPRP